MEQLCVHALLVQLYAPQLVREGEVPAAGGGKGFGGSFAGSKGHGGAVPTPAWLGKDYQLKRQTAEAPQQPSSTWQRGSWRMLAPLVEPMAAPLEWVEPVLVGG